MTQPRFVDMNIRDDQDRFLAQITVDQQRAALAKVDAQGFTSADLAHAFVLCSVNDDASWRAADTLIKRLHREEVIATCSLTRWKIG